MYCMNDAKIFPPNWKIYKHHCVPIHLVVKHHPIADNQTLSTFSIEAQSFPSGAEPALRVIQSSLDPIYMCNSTLCVWLPLISVYSLHLSLHRLGGSRGSWEETSSLSSSSALNLTVYTFISTCSDTEIKLYNAGFPNLLIMHERSWKLAS